MTRLRRGRPLSACKGVFLSIILGVLVLCGAFPQESPPVVERIQVSGLRRTQDSYMQAVLAKYRGMPADQLDTHLVESELQAEGLFSDIAVEVVAEDGAATLSVTVRERVSFLPIPFVAYSDDSGLMGGGVVMDMNAFGVKDMFVIGGIASRSLGMGMATFVKPSLGLTRPGFTLTGMASKSSVERTDIRGGTVLEYDALGGMAGFSVQDKVTAHTQVSIGVRYTGTSVTAGRGYEGMADSVRALSFTGGYGVSVPDWNGWFLSERKASVDGTVSLLGGGDVALSAGISLALQQPIGWQRLRLIAHASGVAMRHAPVTMWQGGAAAGAAILASGFASPRLAVASAGLELAVLRTPFALFSLYGLYQGVVAEDADGRGAFQHGWNAGSKMYLSRIAFPAFAVGVTRNVSTGTASFSCSFGLSL